MKFNTMRVRYNMRSNHSIVTGIASALCLFFSPLTVADSVTINECTIECQIKQIEAYFAALDRISLKNSNTDDIDALLALMHDDVKYIHVEYQANFNKESWRRAFIRNLKRGVYQDSNAEEMHMVRYIPGKNHIAVEYSHGERKVDGSWVPGELNLAVFGFKDGKISLIRELW